MRTYIIIKKAVATFLLTVLFIGVLLFVNGFKNADGVLPSNVETLKFVCIYVYAGFIAFEVLFFIYMISGAIEDFPEKTNKDDK